MREVPPPGWSRRRCRWLDERNKRDSGTIAAQLTFMWSFAFCLGPVNPTFSPLCEPVTA
jgi:hypothetical protein